MGVCDTWLAAGSGYNPTHTIEALAHSVASYIVQNGANLLPRRPALTPATSLPNTKAIGSAGSIGAVAAGVTAGLAATAAATRRPQNQAPAEDK